jgi:putative MFS transporter
MNSIKNESDDETSHILSKDKIDEDDLLLIDKITSRYGYGLQIWEIIICAVLVIGVDAYFTTIYSSMLLAYQIKYSLVDNDLMLIAVIFFIFKIFGAMACGQMTQKYSRTYVINVSLFLLTVVNYSMSLYNNLYFYYATRMITGYLAGTIETVITNVLCEHLPIKYRGFVLTSVWTGWSIAQIIPNIIMMNIMPNFEAKGIESVIFLSTLIPLTSFIFCLCFFKDSARSYIMRGDYDKAFDILKRYEHLTEEMKHQLVKEIKEGVNKDTEASVSELFKSDFFTLTFCILFLSFMSNMLNDGFALIVTLTLDEINDSKNVLKDSMIVILFSMPSCIMAGMFSENRTIGRKWCNLIGYLLLASSIAGMTIMPRYIPIFLGLYNIFINFGNIIIITYASEIYPTKIRDMASGMTSTFANLGSLTSQLVFLSLHNISTFAPYYFIVVICMICVIVSSFLPYETYHRPLDSKYTHEDKKEHVKKEHVKKEHVKKHCQ